MKPKVFTGVSISIVKLDLHVLQDLAKTWACSHPESLSQYRMFLLKLYLCLLLKLTSKFNFTFKLGNKNKKKATFVLATKKQKQKNMFKKNDLFFFFDLQHYFRILYYVNNAILRLLRHIKLLCLLWETVPSVP